MNVNIWKAQGLSGLKESQRIHDVQISALFLTGQMGHTREGLLGPHPWNPSPWPDTRH